MSKYIHMADMTDLFKTFGTEGKPLHPLVAVLDFTKSHVQVEVNTRIGADFYAILFKEYSGDNIRYGRKSVDFRDGRLVCLSPGQTLEMDSDEETDPTMAGWGLFFHPDFIRNTSLIEKMKDYTFFSYEVSESLHLSDKEKQLLNDCLQKIESELLENIDVHSQAIIVSSIELLLNYCSRFYGRQFITRKHSNNDVVMQVEKLLAGYFQDSDKNEKGLPTVKYLASHVNLSPGYLGDLLKKETGRNAQDHIHFHLIEEAKSILLNTHRSVSEIAYSLGFEYPQYFTKLFKRKTGKTPVEFRNMN
ncbi:MAG: AraC family transcriptional regulator [Chitinophagaceae bacterium]|nr:MAG: AraC family transcriptional regulator [Chitinophagaceae bacterium]